MRKNRIGQELERAFRFIREFGIWGLPFYSRYLLARHGIGSALQIIKLPGITAPIEIRKATSDTEVFYQVFVFKTYDFSYCPQYSHLQLVYRRAVENGERPLIIDCGASIELSSIWYALRFPKARIYAVEPNKGNFAMLQKNVKAYSNIVPLHAAIWNENTRVKIIDESAEAWAFRVEPATAGDIAAMTVPDIMQHAAATKILLIKIDIEGAEQELFSQQYRLAEFSRRCRHRVARLDAARRRHKWRFYQCTGQRVIRDRLARRDNVLREDAAAPVRSPFPK